MGALAICARGHESEARVLDRRVHLAPLPGAAGTSKNGEFHLLTTSTSTTQAGREPFLVRSRV